MNVIPKVSIVIPVYNAQSILERCIESVLAQSLTDFELLLVNDGSKDDSGAICNRYALSDQRVKIFHKPNGGVSSARNFGLNEANGDYITFIDADDYVGERFLETFFSLDPVPKTALVQQGYLNEFRKDKVREVAFKNGIYGQEEFSSLFSNVDLTRTMPHPFPKLYDTTIIRDHRIRYNENFHNGEDIMFLLEYMYHINRCVFIDSKEYHYSYSLGSLSYWYGSFETESRLFQQIRQRIDLLSEKFNLNKKFYNYYVPSFLFRSILSLYLIPNRRPKSFRIKALEVFFESENSRLIRDYDCRSSVEKAFKYLFTRKLLHACDYLLLTFAGLRVVYYHYRKIAEQ